MTSPQVSERSHVTTRSYSDVSEALREEKETSNRLRIALSRLQNDHDILYVENDYLRSLLQLDVLPPPAWKLTGKEGDLFIALMNCKGVLSKDMALSALYGGRDEPEQKIIDVFICKLRTKTAPFGVAIETIWGRGWRLRERERWIEELKGSIDREKVWARTGVTPTEQVIAEAVGGAA